MSQAKEPGLRFEPPIAAPCPVCRRGPSHLLMLADDRRYFACPVCQTRFVDPRHHPSRAAEHAHYLLHENCVDDPRYRRFLSKLADPLLARLRPASRGLDYGCGPGPALAAMLREAGHNVAVYDPFFAPDCSSLERSYEFITCTEVAEHFHQPRFEFDRLMAMIRPGGWLAVMTSFQTDDALFAQWRYRKDPTHVVFYREVTFRWMAATHGWSCEIPAKDVVLMQRPWSGGTGVL